MRIPNGFLHGSPLGALRISCEVNLRFRQDSLDQDLLRMSLGFSCKLFKSTLWIPCAVLSTCFLRFPSELALGFLQDSFRISFVLPQRLSKDSTRILLRIL